MTVMENVPAVEAAAIQNGEGLQHLGGLRRTQESTIGAVGDVLGGLKQVALPSRGESRIGGAARIAEGVFNAADIIPSAIADGARAFTGPDMPKGQSQYNYNISRALGSFQHAKKPQHLIGGVIDTIHAVTTRAGTDIMRAIRRNSSNQSLSA